MRDAADNPGADAIHRLAEGKRNIIGNKPGFSLCEPPGQFGAYQAEIYVNPGEKGNLFLRIFSRDRSLGIDKQMTLPALFSENREELAAINAAASSSAGEEAVDALVMLGYTKTEAASAVGRLDQSLSSEELIKQALRLISKNI